MNFVCMFNPVFSCQTSIKLRVQYIRHYFWRYINFYVCMYVRYDTISYFNVRSKADVESLSQLSLSQGTKTKKCKRDTETCIYFCIHSCYDGAFTIFYYSHLTGKYRDIPYYVVVYFFLVIFRFAKNCHWLVKSAVGIELVTGFLFRAPNSIICHCDNQSVSSLGKLSSFVLIHNI